MGAGDLAQVLILPTPEHLPAPRQLIYMWDLIVLASSHSLQSALSRPEVLIFSSKTLNRI